MRESLKNYLLSLGAENNLSLILNMVPRARTLRAYFDNTIPQDPFFYLFGPKYLAGLIVGGLFIDKGGSVIKPLTNRARHIWEGPFSMARFKG